MEDEDGLMQKSMSDELKETIRSLRHINSSANGSTASGQHQQQPKVETAKIRQLNKVAPLQYHRTLPPESSSSAGSGSGSDSAGECGSNNISAISDDQPTVDASSTTFDCQIGRATSSKPNYQSETLQRMKLKQHGQPPATNNQVQTLCSLSRTQSLRDVNNEQQSQQPSIVQPSIFKVGSKLNGLTTATSNGEHRWSYTERPGDVSTTNGMIVQAPVQPTKPPRAIVRPVVPPRQNLNPTGSKSSNVPPPAPMQPSNVPTQSTTVNKETIVELYRLLDCNLSELKQRTSTANSSAYIQLSDKVQQFKTMCAVYAENISPHGKFRFRELVTKLDGYVPKLRTHNGGSHDEQERLLRELEITFRDLILLVQR